jgi:hypothetical protein
MKLHDLVSAHKGKNVAYSGALYKLADVGDDYFRLEHTSAPGVVSHVNIPFTAIVTFVEHLNKGVETVTVHLVRDQTP